MYAKSLLINMPDLTEFFKKFDVGFGLALTAFFLMLIFFAKIDRQPRKR